MTESATPFLTQLAYRRRPTRTVRVGEVGVGGSEPIRIQSMLTCETWDVARVMAEMHALQAAGCEIVRVTVPTRRDLEALPEIRRRMAEAGLRMPLVADIHFNPRLALECVPHVDKVRINPGNFVDQKRFAVREYSAAEYADELERVEAALLPLIEALKRHGRALRVGVNHGSLSDRVINRYGDTPLGMVEAAMEFLRILRRNGYEESIVSMKSSNPLVVIEAYRLLALTMEREGMDYPLHLGVTEAGDGLDGRVKSAVGIGSLLCDGLGDTVRVSLTEPAANEIPAARQLVAAVEALRHAPAWPEVDFRAEGGYRRRDTQAVSLGAALGGGGAPVAFLALAESQAGAERLAQADFDEVLAPPGMPNGFPGGLPDGAPGTVPLARLDELTAGGQAAIVDDAMLESPELAGLLGRAGKAPGGTLLLLRSRHPLYPLRRLAGWLDERGLRWPLGVVLPHIGEDELPLGVAAEIGNLAADGLIDAVACPADRPEGPLPEFGRVLLQAARLRTYKTEFISCPSCGRTLFDLEATTARIKARTAHLKGVRIAVMGCIVNGPGEMADADFGYVGGAPGRIALYKGHTLIERSIPTEDAVERLVDLIKAEGRWVEPPDTATASTA
ncbi:MAG: (E)-4-hydroxy-3-methylbut-2-enyl-diphosphate synthase [SAR324 cluster bacterium]|nr:(E)-4-hydroxy-3-methylbut-2-enyl-diphosphate synthase [SAR324 cluster bacterium]